MTPPARPLPRRALPARLAVPVLLAAALGACGDDGSDAADVPDELRGWTRGEVLGHADMTAYDQVAVASDGSRTAWLSRARGNTDVLGVSEWSATGDRQVEQTDLAMPGGTANGLAVPAAMAVDDAGWTGVAELKDEPGGRSAALAVWSGAAGAPGSPATLDLPEGHVVSRTVAAGRSPDVAAVLALTGEAPSTVGLPEASTLALWTAPVGGDGTVDPAAWTPAAPDLGTDGPLASARLAGDGRGLVLAGATADGLAGVWTSTDGTAWEPVAGDPPSGVDEVDVLAPLGDGTALIGWTTGDDGREAELWRLDGAELRASGTIAAPEGATLDIAGAAAAGDRLVVGGSTRRTDTTNPMMWASAAGGDGADGGDGDAEWVASDQPELVGHLDWTVAALAGDGEDRLGAVLVAYPSHIDVATWGWDRPEE